MKPIECNTVSVATNAPRTSRLAAQAVLPKTGTLRKTIYDFFYARGLHGATDEEAQRTLHIDGNTLRPARGSLVSDGFLIDTGLTRKNDKGRDCIVWRVVEQGMLL